MYNLKQLKKEIQSKKAWWIADLLSLINDKISNEAMQEFRTALSAYGDYPSQSQATSELLLMFVDDINA